MMCGRYLSPWPRTSAALEGLGDGGAAEARGQSSAPCPPAKLLAALAADSSSHWPVVGFHAAARALALSICSEVIRVPAMSRFCAACVFPWAAERLNHM